MQESTYAPYERILLERLKFAVTGIISAEQLQDANLRFAEDFLAPHIRWMFEAKLLGKKDWEEEDSWSEKEEDFPVSWWDHLKLTLKTHWPRLFGRLRVRTREVSVTVRRNSRTYKICPHLQIASKSDCVHLDWLQHPND